VVYGIFPNLSHNMSRIVLLVFYVVKLFLGLAFFFESDNVLATNIDEATIYIYAVIIRFESLYSRTHFSVVIYYYLTSFSRASNESAVTIGQ